MSTPIPATSVHTRTSFWLNQEALYTEYIKLLETDPSLKLFITRSFSSLLLLPVSFSTPGTTSTVADIRSNSALKKAARIFQLEN